MLIAVSSSCARNVVVVTVSSQGSGHEEKELFVTGRPIISKSDSYPPLQIEGFYKPNGERCYINSPVADEVLERKLDPGKTYRFHLYTTHQKYAQFDYYHAMLSKVEEAGSTVIDATIYDVHGRQMEFGSRHPGGLEPSISERGARPRSLPQSRLRLPELLLRGTDPLGRMAMPGMQEEGRRLQIEVFPLTATGPVNLSRTRNPRRDRRAGRFAELLTNGLSRLKGEIGDRLIEGL